jgi:hypothetical protein
MPGLAPFKILAGLTDEQLDRFAGFMEIQGIPQWATIVKQGDRGDAMYRVLGPERCAERLFVSVIVFSVVFYCTTNR